MQQFSQRNAIRLPQASAVQLKRTLLVLSRRSQEHRRRKIDKWGGDHIHIFVLGMCRILFCRIPDSSLPDTGQEKMMTGYRIIQQFASKHKPQTFSRVCLRLKRDVYAGISSFPGGSTPGLPRGFVKTVLTKGH